jgi:carbon starvation protein
MWGWGPALIWVILGSIFIGGMHDMAVLVVSLRNQGMTIGEIAGRLLNPRVRLLFLVLLLFALWVVLAIFGWVIASVFVQFPEAILPVFLQIPIAVFIGTQIHRRGRSLRIPCLVALALMYATVWLGAGCPGTTWTGGWFGEFIQEVNYSIAAWPIWLWIALLLAYCYLASVLPVWVLLQPRDFINSLQLLSSLGLVVLGLVATAAIRPDAISSHTDAPTLRMFAPFINFSPQNAPPIFPFLFVTIACGAVSGFHCLVSSGTSSKQLQHETDAYAVGYGSMLLEGFLAVLVIIAVGGGIGLGWPEEYPGLSGTQLWHALYSDWKDVTGGKAIAAFVVGSGNFLESLGIGATMSRAIIGVLVASFAGTTLDTATRLQRYVVQELSGTLLKRVQPSLVTQPLRWLTTTHGATLFAVTTAFCLAMLPAPGKGWSLETIGTGGLILWPLFGATNQLLAGLSLLVVSFYLRRRKLPTWIAGLPMIFMLAMPAWALFYNIQVWLSGGNFGLVIVALVMLAIEIWLIIEGILLWGHIQGVLEIPLETMHTKSQKSDDIR